MQQVYPDETRLYVRVVSMTIAAIFLLATMCAEYRYIGWPPVIIVGGSGTAAFVLWSLTYLRRPSMPEIILPPFLLTVAALNVPVGLALFPKEPGGTPPRSFAERTLNMQRCPEMSRASHFAALEEPELFSHDVVVFFHLLSFVSTDGFAK
jgi:hypothetical protein